MLQSPNIQKYNKDDNTDDSKLTATANFEKPTNYDVKYSDYRNAGSRERSYGDRPSYEQQKQGDRESYINPFKTREGLQYSRPDLSSGNQSFNYNPAAEFQSRGYSYQPPGSYKYQGNSV
jgi:hypothetical protein